MDKELILKIVSNVMEILPSSRHTVTFDMYTNQSITVYIHCMQDTNSFVSDSRSIDSKEEYPRFNKWLTGWKSIIETERDFDETN